MKEVFVSSTVKDLKDYRKAVREDFQRYVGVGTLLLNEDAQGGGYDATVEKCKENVLKCDAYLGIFAYYYGSIPPNQVEYKSITHLEFIWAMDKWGRRNTPPIFIFMPNEDCDSCAPEDSCDYCMASKDLQKKAANLLKDRDDAYIKEHARLLEQFHMDVKNPKEQWRIVKFFWNKIDLTKQIQSSWRTWELEVLKAAQQASEEDVISLAPAISDQSLGLLGREEQVRVAKKVVNQVLRSNNAPAVCLLVHGTAKSGQEVFCSHLISEKPFKPRNGKLKLSRPQTSQYGLEALLHWVCKKFPLPENAPFPQDVDTLAELLITALEHHPITLFLDEIRRFQGGLPAFYRLFWQPLHAKLEELDPPNPLVMVVNAYSSNLDAWEPFCCDATSRNALEYSQLLYLPELGEIDEEDLETWLDDIEIPPQEWDALIDEALLKWDGDNGPDHTPLNVFDRIRKDFKHRWPHEGAWIDED